MPGPPPFPTGEQAGPGPESQSADWTPALRREWCALLWTAGASALVLLAGIPAVHRFVLDRPLGLGWLTWVASLGVLSAVLLPLATAAGRARWAAATHHRLRIEHALRHHVDIGPGERQAVTDRAALLVALAQGAHVGWPAVACALVVLMRHRLDLDGIATASLALLAGAAAAAGVAASRRRARPARRWLADPAPAAATTSTGG